MRRKVFRVEQMFASGGTSAPHTAAQRRPVDEFKALRTLAEQYGSNAADAVQILKQDLALIHEIIARNRRDLATLIGDGKERKMARAAGELGAAVEGMEKATETILKSVEVVDESARALTATLKDDYQRGLAHDIQDHVIKVYEACNFQDLAGQRIGNVVRILNAIEEQVTTMLERFDAVGAEVPAPTVPADPSISHGLLNGPRLDGDSGHASQNDIDEMFG